MPTDLVIRTAALPSKSLQASIDSLLRPSIANINGTSPSEVTRIDVLIEFDRLPYGLPAEVLDRCLAEVGRWFAPTDGDAMMRAVSGCRARTARPQENKQAMEDEALFMAALVDDLAPYPGDVIEAVFKKWPQENRFFPNNWFDLKSKLDAKMTFRIKAKRILSERLAFERDREATVADGIALADETAGNTRDNGA